MIEHSKSTIGSEERKNIVEVIKTNYLAEGETVRNFEKELCKYIGGKGAVATSTGTLAIHLALVCLGVGRKDEVIVPSYVCRSVLNAVLYSGARPVICDVNVEDYNISLGETLRKISRKTRVVIVPHMYGCPAEIGAFVRHFKDSGIYIIEDCAHSIGAEYRGRKVGSFGDLSVFSFEGTKYITTGEGGIVLANSDFLLDRLRKLKEPDSFDYKIKYTYRMTNLQAAIGRAQLLKLDSFIKRRNEIAKIYQDILLMPNIELPKLPIEGRHIFHRFMIRIKGNVHVFMERCYKKGVKVKQPVKPYPLHWYMKLSANDFPATEYIMKSAVSVPIYPLLTNKKIEIIADVVRKSL